MNRRALLTGVGVGFIPMNSGCLGNIPSDNGDSNQQQGDDAESRDDDDSESNGATAVEREVEFIEMTDVPNEAPFTFDIEFTSSKLSESEMPQFELTVRNESDQTQVVVVDDGQRYVVPHFSDPAGLRTIAEDEFDEATPAEPEDLQNDEESDSQTEARGCLAVSTLSRDADDFLDAHDFAPTTEIVTRYAIVGHTGAEKSCPEPGRYDLYAHLELNPPHVVDDEAGLKIEFDWGFTVEVY